METYPKTRSPLGTYLAVEDAAGVMWLATLDDWLAGRFPGGKIHLVALTKTPLRSWIRSYNFHEKKTR